VKRHLLMKSIMRRGLKRITNRTEITISAFNGRFAPQQRTFRYYGAKGPLRSHQSRKCCRNLVTSILVSSTNRNCPKYRFIFSLTLTGCRWLTGMQKTATDPLPTVGLDTIYRKCDFRSGQFELAPASTAPVCSCCDRTMLRQSDPEEDERAALPR